MSLMTTVRNEIASCEESAYESLPLKDAATLLFFTSQSGLLKFAQQVNTFESFLSSMAHLVDSVVGK